jgi:T1SS-143 domain-containing protein
VTESVLFNALAFEDDGPTLANAVVSSEVDEDGLAGGNPGGPDDLDADDGSNDDNDGDETTASGNIAGLFVGGADGLASFGLSDDPLDLAGLPQSLSSKGDAVTYSVVGNKLTASAGGREVFTLEITNAATGAYLFTLKDQLDHGTVDTEDEINLQLGAILMATDGDGDTATAQADDLVITVDDDTPDPLQPGDITADNEAGATASAALGYYGRVGADEDGTVSFVGGTDGDVLQGIVQDGTPALENLLFDGSNIYLWGFGTDELIGTTQNENPFDDANTSDWVFKMSLNPDGAVQASDTYDITMYKTVANVQDVDFGAFVSKVASGNPLYKLVEDIGGSTYDALFSGWIGAVQQTVNIATVGVGVGTGQDFNAGDRMMIQFLEDDGAGDAVVSNAEERVVNRFTFVMNQNNPPHDDGDLTIRVYDAAGNEIQITGILINGETLVGAGGGPVDSNDDNGSVTADANGLGFDLHGLGGGTGGSLSDNDTVTVIAAGGYVRIDVIGTGADTNKDTFDILVKSVAIPVVYDIDFSVQAALVDEDLDTTLPADLDVTLVGVVGV